MNRCKATSNALFPIASYALLAGVTGLFPLESRAQVMNAPQTQNEAQAGGRNFPIDTLRGKLHLVNAPQIELDGQPERLAPGARIRSAQNMLVMPGSLAGQKLLVNYTRDAAGLVHQVWILTPDEANIARQSAGQGLGTWPFAVNSRPRDDGKTPFDQLPKYGE